MSEVAKNILNLAVLLGVEPQEIQHFVAPRTGQGDVILRIPNGRCVVITRIIQKNVDTSQANTIKIVSAGKAQDVTRELDMVANEEVFYAFRSGELVMTFAHTPQGGMSAHTQVVYYELPGKALEVLQHCATRLVPQS